MFSKPDTSPGVFGGFLDVAMTLWPCFKAYCARERPKPEEQPEMSQTGAEVDIVGLGINTDSGVSIAGNKFYT